VGIVTKIFRLAFLVLVACSHTQTWTKSGAAPVDFYTTKAACTNEATERWPPVTHIAQVAPGVTTIQQNCSTSGGGYHCTYAGSTYIQPVYKTIDDNQAARDADVNDCLKRDGWKPSE